MRAGRSAIGYLVCSLSVLCLFFCYAIGAFQRCMESSSKKQASEEKTYRVGAQVRYVTGGEAGCAGGKDRQTITVTVDVPTGPDRAR
jgi:hypothetical protein